MFSIRTITKGALMLAAGMALTPAAFTAGPLLETRFFPVVRDADITSERPVEPDVIFTIRFGKVRQCEFIGLAWYQDDVRLRVDFHPDVDVQPPAQTRPTGQQHAGPWRLRGVERLDGTRAFTLHRCHPLWLTISHFYGQRSHDPGAWQERTSQ